MFPVLVTHLYIEIKNFAFFFFASLLWPFSLSLASYDRARHGDLQSQFIPQGVSVSKVTHH